MRIFHLFLNWGNVKAAVFCAYKDNAFPPYNNKHHARQGIREYVALVAEFRFLFST